MEDPWTGAPAVPRRRRPKGQRQQDSRHRAHGGGRRRAHLSRALGRVLRRGHHRIRLRAAQALAAGGNDAYVAIRDEIDTTLEHARALSAGERWSSGDPRGRPPVELPGMDPPVAHGDLRPLGGPAVAARPGGARELGCLDRSGAPPGSGVVPCPGLQVRGQSAPSPNPAEHPQRPFGLAGELLESSEWWYSESCLLQALVLWSLRLEGEARADIHRRLTRWTGDDRHPLVAEAARLCEEAMGVRREPRRPGRKAPGDGPGRYIRIDETGVVAKSAPGRRSRTRRRRRGSGPRPHRAGTP